MRISIKILAYLPLINAFNEKFLLKIKDLYEKEALEPYYIYNNKNNTNNDQIVSYHLIESIKFQNQSIWSGNIYMGYKNIYEYLLVLKPQKLPKVLDLMIEKVVTMEDIYKNNPIIYYYNNITKEIVLVFILDDVFDTIIIKAKEGPLSDKMTATYTITSIEKHEKSELIELWHKLTKYSVGMLLQTPDLRLLEKLSIKVSVDNKIEYHLLYYENHFYGDCNKTLPFIKRPTIYFIITLDERNVINNLVLKTKCCTTV